MGKYFGQRGEEKCKCQNGTCHRADGFCFCDEVFYGRTCNETHHSNETKLTEVRASTVDLGIRVGIGIGIGIVIGAVVAAVIAMVVFFVIKSKNLACKEIDQNSRNNKCREPAPRTPDRSLVGTNESEGSSMDASASAKAIRNQPTEVYTEFGEVDHLAYTEIPESKPIL